MKFSLWVTSSIAASWISFGVMHTGHPGPEIISTPVFLIMAFSPYLCMVMVCVPQTLMSWFFSLSLQEALE
jgi:hypothetical protein